MKTFEGLSIPEKKQNQKIEIIQAAYCKNSYCECNSDSNIECEDCLFSDDHLVEFEKWYNLKYREEKLDRILK